MSDVIQLVCEGQLVYLLVGSYDTSSYRSFVSAHEEKNSLRRLHPSSKKKKKTQPRHGSTRVQRSSACSTRQQGLQQYPLVAADCVAQEKKSFAASSYRTRVFLPGLPLGLPLVPERIMRDGRAINLIYLSRCVLDFRTLLNRATTNRG